MNTNTNNTQKNEWVKKHPKTTGVIAIFSLLIILSIMFSGDKKENAVNKVAVQEQKMLFNIPAYYDKDISEIKKELGEPYKDTKANQKGVFETAELGFNKDNFNLLAEYNIKTNKAVSFFVSKKGDEVMTISDKEILAKVANVNFEDKSYKAKYVPMLNDSAKFTGLTIDFKQTQIAEWDKLVATGKEAKVIYKDTRTLGDTEVYEVYVDRNWYLLKVDQKKNLISKFSTIKEKITGFKNIKFKDSNSNELVAEVTSFSGSVEVYK